MSNTILIAPAAHAQFVDKNGITYTADANSVITIPTDQVPEFIKAGCIYPPDAVTGKNNLTATTAPLTTSDSAAGYGVGSQWFDTTNKKEYTCIDATASAAVWVLNGIRGKIVNVTAATLTITAEKHAGKIITANKADGIAFTLPAATGTGDVYEFIVGTTITSVGTTIKAASASDSFIGNAWVISDNSAAVLGYIAASGTDDTVTLNGTTTGGYSGHKVRVTDVASGSFFVESFGKATGTEATPFSATVS